MAITAQRYPFSTPEGAAIPLDILRPVGVLKKDFLSASGSAAEALPANTLAVLVRATRSCFIRFSNAPATKPISATPSVVIADTLYLEEGEIQTISPGKLFYSVIGDTEAGTLTMQILETWAGLVTEAQINRV